MTSLGSFQSRGLDSGSLLRCCQVPFLHLEPLKFSSCNSESLKAQAFQGEVDKMLGKVTSGMVEDPAGLRLPIFLVQKVSGGWRPVIDLLSLNSYVTLIKFKMEMASLVFGAIRKEDVMFFIDMKDAYFKFPIHQCCGELFEKPSDSPSEIRGLRYASQTRQTNPWS